MNELFKHKTERVYQRSDVYICKTNGEWYDCDVNEYVKDDKVYCKFVTLVEKHVGYYFNPAINQYQCGSDFLQDNIADEKVRWLANMVTYYRHTLQSWNKCWEHYGNHYRYGWFKDYNEEKRKINERQKRKIIRNHLQFLKKEGIGIEHFKKLQYTDQQTIEFAEARYNGAKSKALTK